MRPFGKYCSLPSSPRSAAGSYVDSCVSSALKMHDMSKPSVKPECSAGFSKGSLPLVNPRMHSDRPLFTTNITTVAKRSVSLVDFRTTNECRTPKGKHVPPRSFSD